MIKRRRWIASIGVIALLLLTACSATTASADSPYKASPYYASAITVPLPDGRSVICVVYDDSTTGTNLSCDWQHAR